MPTPCPSVCSNFFFLAHSLVPTQCLPIAGAQEPMPGPLSTAAICLAVSRPHALSHLPSHFCSSLLNTDSSDMAPQGREHTHTHKYSHTHTNTLSDLCLTSSSSGLQKPSSCHSSDNLHTFVFPSCQSASSLQIGNLSL